MRSKLLIVDDEEDLCFLLQESLDRLGYDADTCSSVKEAKCKLEKNKYDLVLTDLNMGSEYGLELVSYIVEKHSSLPVIVMSAYGNQDISVMALKMGAYDFINKPIDNQMLDRSIKRALSTDVCDANKDDAVLSEMIGESDVIQVLKKRILKISKGQAPVYIHGESGAGKEVVASIVHKLSGRCDGPYIAINCGAIPDELIESELFGHKKGSFTGATQDKIGLIQSAEGGSLFLDEVAELPFGMQVKLLRAVQEKKIRPIGSEKEISVDFRLISATHRNLEVLVQQGKFRQDLYFRLHVMDVVVPPLRERGQDIILLAEYFVGKICKEWSIPKKNISPEVKKWLMQHKFPGNVRELNNFMQRAITLSDSEYVTLEEFDVEPHKSNTLFINLDTSAWNGGLENNFSIDVEKIQKGIATGLAGLPQNFPPQVSVGLAQVSDPLIDSVYLPLDEGLENYMDGIEKKILCDVLDKAHKNITVAAKMLKLTPRSMRYRLQKFGLSAE